MISYTVLVGKKHTHTCRIIEVEDLLEVKNILLIDAGSNIEARIEFSQILALESNIIEI
jgi:hypothetical protein